MSALPVVVLQDVDCPTGGPVNLLIQRLQINAGERVALIGHNGAGKSTLLRLLSGFVHAQTGQVNVLGRDLHQPQTGPQMRALRRELGQIMQSLHLVGRLTVLENALIGGLGRISGWRGWTRCFPAHEVAAARQALDAVGLLDRADARTDSLSGGERQKVALARLLMQRPQLILADEPTAALDPSAAREVCQLLVTAAAGATLISVVHNPALLPLLAERVIGIKNGRIVFDLPISDITPQGLEVLYQADGAATPHTPDAPQAARSGLPSPLAMVTCL
jgi:phosphonate transport system ATP-binding protein